MQTTDLHGQILGYDYFQDRPDPHCGMDRLARLIATARAEVPGSILCDSGDFLQGTPVCDVAAQDHARDPDALHPVVAAMNLLRYDVAAPGNHEFDFGLPLLRAVIAQARFPMTCANLRELSATAPSLFAPSVLLRRRLRDQAGRLATVRVGLFGIVPPLIAVWGRDHVRCKLEFDDPVATARRMVANLRACGADIVVALNHTGIAPPDEPAAENTALLVAALPGIDAVLCGHQHRLFPGPDFAGLAGVDAVSGLLQGKPAVMAGTSARHLGIIDLTLGQIGGRWGVTGSQVTLRSLPAPPEPGPRPAPAFARTLSAAHDRTLTHIRRKVGETVQPLHSYFVQIGDCTALRVVAEAQTHRLRALLADGPLADLPLLSAVAPFRAGGRGGADNYTDIAIGLLTIRHLADLYPYPNMLAAVVVTGAQIADWLERSAGMFHRLIPGKPDQPLIRTDFPSYNFDVIFGLTYGIDLTQPARYDPDGSTIVPGATRITNLCIGGRPLERDARVVVATNSYRAAGGGFFTNLASREHALPVRDSNLSVLTDYVQLQHRITPQTDPVWRFVPMPGTTALFETGPRAYAYLTEAPGLQAIGRAPDGFARFRLTL
jgi:2',3'-cyclic-nucleotide 2'-phosphodiesterase/3'-nucleotidase